MAKHKTVPATVEPVTFEEGRAWGEQWDPEEGIARVHVDTLWTYADAIREAIVHTDMAMGNGNLGDIDGWSRIARQAGALEGLAWTIVNCTMKDDEIRRRERLEEYRRQQEQQRQEQEQ
jgi:hypothetical protein